MALASSSALIDVVVPAHNVAAWIGDCLESLRAQTFPDWRAIVVLDGCTDATERIARRFARRDPRIHVHSRPREGVGAARNWGLLAGDARYVAFLDADDVLPSNALEVLHASLSASGSQFAAGRAIEFTENGGEHPYWTMASGLFDEARTATTLAAEPRLVLDHTCWNKLYERDFLVEHELTFAADVVIGEDALHTLSAIVAARAIDIVDATVYRHRVRPGSLSSALRTPRAVGDWVDVTTRVVHLLGTAPPAAARLYAQRMLEVEAFTRVRQLDSIPSDALVARVIGLVREVMDVLSGDGIAGLPFVQRTSYAALGLGDAAAARTVARLLEEMDSASPADEFAALASAWGLSGTELHARVWRECILGPARRASSLVGDEGSAGAAIVGAFAERFVAAHALTAEERRSLAAGAFAPGPVEKAEARVTRATRRSLDIRFRVPLASLGHTSLTARSRGRIGGLHVVIRGVNSDAGEFTLRLRDRDLRPCGRWSLELETADGTFPLRLSAAPVRHAGARTRRIWTVGRIGEPLSVETRPSLPTRVSESLETWMRERLPAIAPQRVYRLLTAASRLIRVSSTRSRKATDISLGG